MSWIVTLLKLGDSAIDTDQPKWWESQILPLGTKAEVTTQPGGGGMQAEVARTGSTG